ncbi:MAG TPA: hypothetical protein VKK79_18375, partial [Candidatus Lokiarchaeia archaeon]|nr:hypothetical protein [Candidatus Lokiarchaeia archaeon]
MTTLDKFEVALARPQDAWHTLHDTRGGNLLVILVALFCAAYVLVVWFDSLLVPFASWVDPGAWSTLFGTFQVGSFWYSLVIFPLGMGVYLAMSCVPGALLAAKAQ